MVVALPISMINTYQEVSNMARRFSMLPVAFTAVVATSLVSFDATAMTAYSRKYNLECVKCHDKVPTLNEFGKEFMKNDFELPGIKKVYKSEDELKDSKALKERKEGKDRKE